MGAEKILVVVHPASVCGSANFNIGARAASSARELLIQEFRSWRGSVIVIDGDFREELILYPVFKQALDGVLSRSRKDGFLSLRVAGIDPEQVDRIREVLGRLPAGGRGNRFVVTGAWYHPQDGGGCVGSVLDELREHGCQAELAESAVWIDEMDPDVPGQMPRAA